MFARKLSFENCAFSDGGKFTIVFNRKIGYITSLIVLLVKKRINLKISKPCENQAQPIGSFQSWFRSANRNRTNFAVGVTYSLFRVGTIETTHNEP